MPPVFSVSYLPVAAEHLLVPVSAALLAELLTEAHGDDMMVYEEVPQLHHIFRNSSKLEKNSFCSLRTF